MSLLHTHTAACECNSSGSLSSQCDPISGACLCKPNVAGDECNECLPNFFLRDPSSEDGCQPCSCNVGASTSARCDQSTGQCACRDGVQGRTCSQLLENRYFRAIDYLILEAEESLSDPSAPAVEVVEERQSRMHTGFGFLAVRAGEEEASLLVDFGSLVPPRSGLYDVVIRYALRESSSVWESATLSVLPSLDEDGLGPASCGSVPEVVEEAAEFEYANWMSGVGLSLSRTACLRGQRSYRFVLGNFTSGLPSGNETAVLSIDSLVLIPVDLPGLAVFGDAMIRRDYEECVSLFGALPRCLWIPSLAGTLSSPCLWRSTMVLRVSSE